MKKTFLLWTLLGLVLFANGRTALAEQAGYFRTLGRDFKRGFKNIISAPLEIPITIQEYHERAGRPVIRHITGFFDGTVQTVERFGSGLWDWVAMLVPGEQEGLPVKPETLF